MGRNGGIQLVAVTNLWRLKMVCLCALAVQLMFLKSFQGKWLDYIFSVHLILIGCILIFIEGSIFVLTGLGLRLMFVMVKKMPPFCCLILMLNIWFKSLARIWLQVLRWGCFWIFCFWFHSLGCMKFLYAEYNVHLLIFLYRENLSMSIQMLLRQLLGMNVYSKLRSHLTMELSLMIHLRWRRFVISPLWLKCSGAKQKCILLRRLNFYMFIWLNSIQLKKNLFCFIYWVKYLQLYIPSWLPRHLGRNVLVDLKIGFWVMICLYVLMNCQIFVGMLCRWMTSLLVKVLLWFLLFTVLLLVMLWHRNLQREWG